MNKIKRVSFAIIIGLACVGCNGYNKEPEEEGISTSIEDYMLQEEVHKFEPEDFKEFFKQYFSYTDSEILILNRQYLKESAMYWDNLKTNYSRLIEGRLGEYLSTELTEMIKRQYAHEDIMMPKYSLINNYMVSGNGEVEELEIKSTRHVGESVIYELAVTTINKCYPVEEFAGKHGWGISEDYFIESENGSGAVYKELGIEKQEVSNQNFIYSNNSVSDRMKLQQNFWVTVKQGDNLEIEGIRPAGNWQVGSRDSRDSINTQYINRVPFSQEVDEAEAELVNNIFTKLMSQNKSSFGNLCVAYDTGFKAYENNLESMGLKGVFAIEEKNYKQAYNREISPYKDEIIKLSIDQENIIIEPSVYSTEHQSRYIVTIPAETLQNNNEIVYYNYKYYVGIENGKVEQLHFMTMKKRDEFDHIYEVDEEKVSEVAYD